MAVRLSRQTGDFTAAATWGLVDATSYLNSEAANTGTSSGAGGSSNTFTPGAITIDAIAIKVNAIALATGTITVDLTTGGSGVAGTSVTINGSDLTVTPANSAVGWLVFELAAPVTLLAATAYAVRIAASSGSTLAVFSSTGTNWSRALRTTTTGAPAAGDDLIVAGEYTGAGTGNDITVTMNSTTATDYGAGAASSTVTPALAVCARGTLQYGTAAATNYVLRLSGSLIVHYGGTLNIGTTGTPIPRDSTAVLEFDQLSADGDYGLIGRNGSTVNIQGLSRTSGKDIVVARLKRSVSHNRILQSQTFDNASWTKENITVTADATAAPDATVTADKLTVAAVTATPGATSARQNVSGMSVGPRHVYSVYLKADTVGFAHLTAYASGTSWLWATVNLSTGAITQSGAGGTGILLATGSSAEANGFYRVWMVGTATIGLSFAIEPVPTGTPTIHTNGRNADTTIAGNSIFAWGAQVELEQNLTGPGTYVPTTTALANGGEWKADTDTGWLSGDMVAIASTSQTAADCQAALLSANATADTLTVNHVTAAVAAQAFPLTSGVKGIASAIQEGIATQGTGLSYYPQAEIILVQRNVRIRSTSATLMAYVYFGNTATVDIDWAEFYYIGNNVATKRGIEVDVTTGSFSMRYSCVHDTEAGGVYCNAAANNNILVQHCNFWNCATSALATIQVATTTGHNIVFDNVVIIRQISNNIAFSSSDHGITVTDSTVAGVASTGFVISEVNTTRYANGIFSGLVSHSNATGIGTYSTGLTFTDVVCYRNSGTQGGLHSNASTAHVTVDGAVLFGNNTSNVGFTSGGTGLTVKNAYLNGDLAFATASGVTPFGATLGARATLIDCEFGTVSGIKTTHSGQDFGAAGVEMQLAFENCLFGSAIETTVVTQGTMAPFNIATSQRHDQTAGNHKFWMRNGTGQTDSTIFRTASPSLRMTPMATGYTVTATTASGSPTLSDLSTFASLFVGQHIVGAGIPFNTTITALDYSTGTITLSANATASAAGVTITIHDKFPSAPPGRGIQAAVASGGTLTPSVYVRKNPENRISYSQELDNAAWTKDVGTVTADAEVAPDSTTTADTWTNTGNAGRVRQVLTLPVGTMTCSVYAKAGTAAFLNIALSSSSGNRASAIFDLSGSGAVTLTGDTGTVDYISSAITSVGSGWYRCSLVFDVTVSAAFSAYLQPVTSGTPTVDTNNGLATSHHASGITIHLWGAQLQTGSTLTDYMPTTASELGYYDIEPRLIVRANPSAGIAADTVLDTATAGNNGTWELLTGTTAAVTDDAVLEFYVDCEGAAGWINVDDWSVA